jgi:DNA repair photolyase
MAKSTTPLKTEPPRPGALHGRGTLTNPANRFEALHYERDTEADPSDEAAVETRYYVDPARTIIARNDSPDVSFETSLNPYRGCEHGCVYCFARPTHEFLGLSSGVDFETKIFVKTEAPELLYKELGSRRWKPQTVAVSGVTDCYQPIERKLELTRRCLRVLADFRNPTSVITKNHLVTRDADILGELARFHAASAFISITTLDPALARAMEPRASTPALRLDAIRKLTDAGVPTGVMVAPVVPGLTDHEMPAILEAARDAGAVSAGFVTLRLPHAVKELFGEWLERYYPDRKEKVLNRLRALHDGKLYDSSYGSRQRGHGVFADQTEAIFEVTTRRLGLNEKRMHLSTASFRNIAARQLDLFG